jgi:hypothetical protein
MLIGGSSPVVGDGGPKPVAALVLPPRSGLLGRVVLAVGTIGSTVTGAIVVVLVPPRVGLLGRVVVVVDESTGGVVAIIYLAL